MNAKEYYKNFKDWMPTGKVVALEEENIILLMEKYANEKVIEALANAPLLKNESKYCDKTGIYKH